MAPERAGWTLTAAAVFGLVVSAPAQTTSPSSPVAASKASTKAKDGEAPLAKKERVSQLAAIKVELAWLANQLTFPHPLAVRADGDHLEIGGQVPSAAVRDMAARLAQDESGLNVVNKIVVQPYPLPPVAKQSNEVMCRNAFVALSKDFSSLMPTIQLEAAANGQLKITGTIPTYEQKLAVSRRLSQLSCCTSVVNQLNVTKEESANPSLAKANSDGTKAVSTESKLTSAVTVNPTMPLPPAASAVTASRPVQVSASIQTSPVPPQPVVKPVSPNSVPATVSSTQTRPPALPAAAPVTASVMRTGNSIPMASGPVTAPVSSATSAPIETPYGASKVAVLTAKMDPSAVANRPVGNATSSSGAPVASFATPYGGTKSTESTPAVASAPINRATPYGGTKTSDSTAKVEVASSNNRATPSSGSVNSEPGPRIVNLNGNTPAPVNPPKPVDQAALRSLPSTTSTSPHYPNASSESTQPVNVTLAGSASKSAPIVQMSATKPANSSTSPSASALTAPRVTPTNQPVATASAPRLYPVTGQEAGMHVTAAVPAANSSSAPILQTSASTPTNAMPTTKTPAPTTAPATLRSYPITSWDNAGTKQPVAQPAPQPAPSAITLASAQSPAKPSADPRLSAPPVGANGGVSSKVVLLLQQRIEMSCAGEVRDVQVIPQSSQSLLVRFKVSNAYQGQALSQKILRMKELAPYQVKLEVQVSS